MAPERDVPLPSPADPELENHPVVKGALVLIEVHSDTLRRIEEGAVYSRRNPATGVDEDTTEEIKRLSIENLQAARRLVEEVRREGVFTSVAAGIIRELEMPISEALSVEEAMERVQTTAHQSVQASAEESAADVDTIIHTPEDR